MRTIENPFLQVEVDEGNGIFSIISKRAGVPQLCNCETCIFGRLENGQPFTIQPALKVGELSVTQSEQKLIYSGQDDATGLDWQLSFRLPADREMALWQFEIQNHTSQSAYIDRIMLLEPGKTRSGNLGFEEDSKNDLAFYSNGWQSWSSSGAYAANSRMRQSRLGILQEPMVLNPGTPRLHAKGMFASDFFGVLGNRKSRSGLLLGFLSQRQHFGTLTVDLRSVVRLRLWANGDGACLQAGASLSTDWAVCTPIDIDAEQPLEAYLNAVAQEHGLQQFPPAPAGWCSWYYYYEGVSEDIIRANLSQISEKRAALPLDLVQIDDGFEAQVGDWLEFNPRFLHGVAPLAREISEAGLTPGLWLAPFIVHPDSRLVNEHPGWLLRQANGKLARPGFVWNSLGAALDLTMPEALEYACKVVDAAVHEWGFPYLKLDFLYAAALKGAYHDPTRTRAQVLRGGMEALRRTVGAETVLLGCGAPLGSVLGLVQAMRIGADVSGYWKPTYFGTSLPFKNEPHMPSARNSIQNILTRAPLNRRWWVNDPDCLLVRPDSHLSLEEVRSLATAIGMTGGSVLLSDDIQQLPQKRLELAAALLPPIPQAARVLDWLDVETPRKLRLDLQGATGDWFALAYFNWDDKPRDIHLTLQDFKLPEEDYWVRSFWDDQVWQVRASSPLFNRPLEAHAPLLLALRCRLPDQPQYLGSSVHISQGLEVSQWRVIRRKLFCGLNAGREVHRAKLDLALPSPPKKVKFASIDLEWKALSDGIYRFEVEIPKEGQLIITY